MKITDSRLLILGALAIALTGAPALEAQYGQYGPQAGARIWVDGEPDYFRRGDRLNVNFSVSNDAYVAVVHIDSDGALEFLFPNTPWDVQMVRGGRVHTLPTRGSFANTTIRSRAGMGYLYLIASPYPLDFSYFRGTLASTWDWGYAGRAVHGDPFLALDQITRLLVPRWPYAPYVYDYYGYHVEGIHRYPSYACSDRYYAGGWGWSPTYGGCSRIDYFLTDNPYYYDTRRFRGDRRRVLRPYETLDPRHGFKESPRAPAAGIPSRSGGTDVRSPAFGGTSSGDIQRREPAGPAPRQGGATEPPSRSAAPQREPAPAQRPPATSRENPPPSREAAPPQRAPAPSSRSPEPQQRTPAAGQAPTRGSGQAEPAPSSGRTRPTPENSGGRAEPASNSGSTAPARGRP